MHDMHRSNDFFFNDTAPSEIYALSLHDALPICPEVSPRLPGCPELRRLLDGVGEPRPDLGLTLHRCHDDALGSERLRDPLRALRRRLREVVDLPQDPDIAESRILNRRQVFLLHSCASDAVRPELPVQPAYRTDVLFDDDICELQV